MTDKKKRPAEKLVEAIDNVLGATGRPFIHIDRDEIEQWRKWAKSIDARMRLDGSQRSKQRKPGKRT